MRVSVLSAVVLTGLALAGCEDGGSNNGSKNSVETSPAPIASPTPVPAPSPSPTPPPAPVSTPTTPTNSLDDGRTIVGIEGDSISVDYVGYYAGYFKQRHPTIEVYNRAVGGSGVNTMLARRDQLIALNPDIVTVFIGANDLGSNPTAQAFVDKIIAYATPIRARGTKVLVATNLAISIPANQAFTNNHNLLRDQVATLLRAEVGDRIDGVIDFAAEPVVGQLTAPTNGQLFSDGVHPTDIGYRGAKGGHDYLYEVYRLAVEPLLPR